MIESSAERPTPEQRTEKGLAAIGNALRRHVEQLGVLACEVGPQAAPVLEAMQEHVGRLAKLTERLRGDSEGHLCSRYQTSTEAVGTHVWRRGGVGFNEKRRKSIVRGAIFVSPAGRADVRAGRSGCLALWWIVEQRYSSLALSTRFLADSQKILQA